MVTAERHKLFVGKQLAGGSAHTRGSALVSQIVIPAVSTALFIKKQGKCCKKCWKTEKECEKTVDKKLTMCYNIHNSTDFCKIHDFGGNNNGT